MKKIAIVALLSMVLASGVGCTNMSNTTQGTLSGAALGAAAGLGIAAVSGGAAGWATLAGAGVGALAGGLVGNSHDKRHRYDRAW